MEFFSLDPLNYANGEVITGIESATWVERYREQGEFTIVGEPTKDFQNQLFVGQIISHSDTYEMMIVDTHEIDESKDGPPKLKVSGRSVEADVMDKRVITAGWYYGYKDPVTDNAIGLPLAAAPVWEQAAYLIALFCQANIGDPLSDIPNLDVTLAIAHSDPNEMARFIPTGDLYPQILDLLSSFDGGIKTRRPTLTNAMMQWTVHEGNDLTDKVQFDYQRGDIEKARYFWSARNLRNIAFVQSQYYGIRVDVPDIVGDPVNGWAVGAMHVDFPELSDWYAGSDPDIINYNFGLLIAKGWVEVMDRFRNVGIMDATISSTAQWRYRKHYGIGDIVYVRGNYGMERPMRVTEYAEVMDEEGEHGIPTLSSIV